MRGLIESFNNLHRNIALGMENKADYSMSAIHFWTTPKGDIPQYLFIFSNLDPFGRELNNTACSRSVNMLYL